MATKTPRRRGAEVAPGPRMAMVPAAARERVAFILLLCLGAGDAVGSWRGTSGFQAGFVFSDNLFLTSDDKESGVVFRARPYISASRPGNRVQARVGYGPTALIYPGNAELNDVYHTLSAGVDAELIERYLFLGVAANANQALIDARRNSGFSAITNPDAFSQTASVRVTPRIELPLLGGRFASVRVSPGVGFNFTESSAAEAGEGLDTSTSDTTVSIVSGPMFTTIPWSVNWSRRVFDTDTDRGIGSFTTRVGYIFSPQYRFDVTLGFDESTDAFRSSDGETRGVRWDASFGWTPNTRARFVFGAGERYFGTTYSFDGSYRHKRWVFSGNYDVSIQNAVTELEEQVVIPVRDAFGNPIEDPFREDVVLTSTVTTPVLIEDTFLRDRFLLQSAYSKGRNTASLLWSVTRRDYDEADLDTLDNQLQLRYSRTLSSRLSASAVLNLWDHSEERGDEFDYFQDAVDVVLRYRVGPRTDLGASIGRQNRDGNRPGGDFSENRASLDLTVRF